MLIFLLLYPLILWLLIIILFIKVFKKSHYPIAKEFRNKFHNSLIITSFLFYTLLLLWIFKGIKVFGPYSFSAILFLTGIFTFLYYPLADKSLMPNWFRKIVFVLSITPWLLIAIMTSPAYNLWMKPYGISEALGLGREIVFENRNYRIEKYSKLYSAGDQYYFDIVRKHRLYESSNHVSGYLEEIESQYFKKLINESNENEVN